MQSAACINSDVTSRLLINALHRVASTVELVALGQWRWLCPKQGQRIKATGTWAYTNKLSLWMRFISSILLCAPS